MNSEDVQQRNQEYTNKLLSMKAKIEKFIHKKVQHKPKPSDLSLSNSNLSISNLVSPKSDQIPEAKIQYKPQIKYSAFKQTQKEQFKIVNSSNDDKVIYDIDEVLNKLKNKKGPSLPVDAIKKSFQINHIIEDIPKSKTMNYQMFQDANQLSYNLNPSNDFSKTSYLNNVKLQKKVSHRQEQKNDYSYNISKIPSYYHDQQQQQQQQYSHYNVFNNTGDSQLAYLSQTQKPSINKSHLPPKPGDIQRQTMRQNLIKFRQVSNELNKGIEIDESVNFDLSRSIDISMDDTEHNNYIQQKQQKKVDQRLFQLYKERQQVLKQLQDIEKQLISLG